MFEEMILQHHHERSGVLLNGNDVTVTRYVGPSSPRHPHAAENPSTHHPGFVMWAIHADALNEPAVVTLEDLLVWMFDKTNR